MKRFLTILAALALALGLAAPASAQTELRDDLEEIAARVIDTLDVPDDYTDFTGSREDGPQPGWYLRWSKDGEELAVQCRDDGVITEAWYWRNNDRGDRFYGYDAAFPGQSESDARREAERLLKKLMGENETARIDETFVTLTTSGEYTFSGRVLMNRLESPVTFSIRIGEAGLSSYDRSDSYGGYAGELPAAKAAVTKAQAAPLLKAAAELELYYIAEDGEARLRYVPAGPYTVVDAQSGEAVDMDALYEELAGTPYSANGARFGEAPAAAEMSMDAGNGRALTEVELSSVDRYSGALSREQLDAAARAFDALGLTGFELTRCSYRMDGAGEITASLRYTCEMTEDRLFGFSPEEYEEHLGWGDRPTASKSVELDAGTGELRSVYTSYSLWDRAEAATHSAAAAEAFLKAAAPGKYASSALCTLKGYNEGDDLTYARMQDGFFCPENFLRVRLNSAEGTVDEYYAVWDEDLVFAASTGIVDEAAALDAYTDALTVTLGYTAWPEGIDYDDPVLYAWADWGYTYVESLRLAWYYGGLDEVSGVDALTGEVLRLAPGGGYAYSDLAGVPEREAIEALAEAGVGLPGPEFRPAQALTQRDAARLLLSSDGFDYSAWDDDDLRDQAVWAGFFEASAWDPDGELTQEAFVRSVLAASRYGDAAALPAIGEEAVARALGMTDGPLSKSVCTRAEAAELLYLFMKR